MLDISDIKAACGLITTPTMQGTAYLIAVDRVATAFHLFQETDIGLIDQSTVRFQGTERKATLQTFNEKSDCAILSLNEPLPDRKHLMLGGAVKWKATWDCYGFPNVGKGTGVTLGGIVSDPDAIDDLDRPVIELSSPDVAAGMASPIHGFSGSPVVVDGLVVGHLKRFLSDPDNPTRPAYGKVYATRSECVSSLLSQQGGDYRFSELPAIERPSPGSPLATKHSKKIRELVKQWSKKDLPEDTTVLAAHSLMELGRPDQALNLVATEFKSKMTDLFPTLAHVQPMDPLLVDRSIEILQNLRTPKRLKAVADGLLANQYMTKWTTTGDRQFLDATHTIYLDVFNKTHNWYAGINAAASSLWLDKSGPHETIATAVLKSMGTLSSREMDQCQLGAMGEAYLLVGNLEDAQKYYRLAAQQPGAKGGIKKIANQARQSLDSLGLPQSKLDDFFG